MKFVQMAIRTALQELRRSFLRAMLSLCAVAIGIASLVVSQGVAEGVFGAMQEYIRETGGLQAIRVFDRELSEGRSGHARFWRSLALEDCEILRTNLPDGTVLAPEVGFGAMPFSFRGKSIGSFLIGGTPTYADVNAQRVVAGRMLTEHDVRNQSRVIVISFEVLDGLFASPEAALNTEILVSGIPFTVVGVFGEHVLQMGVVKSSKVINNRFNLIPISVAEGFGGHYSHNVTGIHLKSPTIDETPSVADKVAQLLSVARGGIDDFIVQSREQEIEGWRRNENSTRLGLLILCVLTMLAGGVGIVNVMLASVQERTKEIGIRRAIGASQTHIAIQFIVEAIVLSLMGGIVGVLGSIVAIPIIDKLFTDELPGHPLLLPNAIALGLLCSCAVGVVAGIYPAVKAAHKMPLAAIRND